MNTSLRFTWQIMTIGWPSKAKREHIPQLAIKLEADSTCFKFKLLSRLRYVFLRVVEKKPSKFLIRIFLTAVLSSAFPFCGFASFSLYVAFAFCRFFNARRVVCVAWLTAVRRSLVWTYASKRSPLSSLFLLRKEVGEVPFCEYISILYI